MDGIRGHSASLRVIPSGLIGWGSRGFMWGWELLHNQGVQGPHPLGRVAEGTGQPERRIRLLNLWKLEPEGELEFGGDVICLPDDEIYRR